MKRLYLLRHGQTEFNVKKLVQGRCDSPLTDLGRQQAQAAAEWIKAHGVVPDKVVSSPLGRAMDTASLVACEILGPDA
ncbi:MAG: phosphoglycerate mutase family protein, partial [Collinsella sp.]|nr:phosphoglycerate mutase family protein [Collinsella sp.]